MRLGRMVPSAQGPLHSRVPVRTHRYVASTPPRSDRIFALVLCRDRPGDALTALRLAKSKRRGADNDHRAQDRLWVARRLNRNHAGVALRLLVSTANDHLLSQCAPVTVCDPRPFGLDGSDGVRVGGNCAARRRGTLFKTRNTSSDWCRVATHASDTSGALRGYRADRRRLGERPSSKRPSGYPLRAGRLQGRVRTGADCST